MPEKSRDNYWVNIALLRILESLYWPLYGTVLHTFAGICTTSIAVIECGRRAIAIQEDLVCYRLDVIHLEKNASTNTEKT